MLLKKYTKKTDLQICQYIPLKKQKKCQRFHILATFSFIEKDLY